MVVIQIAEEDASLLKRALELLLSDVRMEIADTDRADFRDGLKQEKRVLQGTIEQLEEQMVTSA